MTDPPFNSHVPELSECERHEENEKILSKAGVQSMQGHVLKEDEGIKRATVKFFVMVSVALH